MPACTAPIHAQVVGVRKSTKDEPAVQRLWLWGFEIFGERIGAGLAPDGCSWARTLPGCSTPVALGLAP